MSEYQKNIQQNGESRHIRVAELADHSIELRIETTQPSQAQLFQRLLVPVKGKLIIEDQLSSSTAESGAATPIARTSEWTAPLPPLELGHASNEIVDEALAQRVRAVYQGLKQHREISAEDVPVIEGLLKDGLKHLQHYPRLNKATGRI